MTPLITLPLALLLDALFGEPPLRYHPLILFGKLAGYAEKRLNPARLSPHAFWPGAQAWCLCVLPWVVLVAVLDYWLGGWWLSVLCGWLALGWRSLRQHGVWVLTALQSGDLAEARRKVGWLVSRDTSQMNEKAISCATVESVLENGSDAIFAPLFWLAVAGAPGVVLYRLSNTLDAMWGYRNARFEQFGKWAARVDDVLNYIPARLTALTYALVGFFKTALQTWRWQAGQWYSPNAGVVMASGAGALRVRLGGAAHYHGALKERPALGMGAEPSARDIQRALQLVDRAVYVWAGLALGLALWGWL